MILTFKERSDLLEILPDRGDVLTLRVVHDIIAQLAITPAEQVQANLRREGDRWVWDQDKAPEADLSFTPPALTVIRDALSSMDKKKTLGLNHLSLYEKFIEGRTNGESP